MSGEKPSLEISISNTDTSTVLLSQKYERLLQRCASLEWQNQELENKLLNVVEKVEHEKILLSNEIDHLAERLSYVTNENDHLKHESVRLKSDCALAVQLLQCHPNLYSQKKMVTSEERKRLAMLLDEAKVSKRSSIDEEAPPEPTCFVRISEVEDQSFSHQMQPSSSSYFQNKSLQCSNCTNNQKVERSTQTEMEPLGHCTDMMKFPTNFELYQNRNNQSSALKTGGDLKTSQSALGFTI